MKRKHPETEHLQIALNATARLVPRFAKRIESGDISEKELAEQEHATLAHYLQRWMQSGDPVWRALYLGERAKMAYDPAHRDDERDRAIAGLVASDRHILETFHGHNGGNSAANVLDELSAIVARLNDPARQSLDVLFVGDCLFLDTTAFLVDGMSDIGVSIRPVFVTDKNPAGIATTIRTLSQKQFDAVFYSPFTYENGLVTATLLNPRAAIGTRLRRDEIVGAMLAEAGMVTRALAETFEAPIFVHNTALIRRHTGRSQDALARGLTAGLRRSVRDAVDTGLDNLIAGINADTFPHVHKFDELRFLKDESERSLGLYYHHHGGQHPARFGALVAEAYALILKTIAFLRKKKLIVCDLDNTLWDGVIGDGDVQHFVDRQERLKRLKEKGVLLAIASKNDPRNVHWEGGVLGEGDFVHSSISWRPKVVAFPEIERSLNLKRKDFVFLDDRADERALVEEAYPDVRTLDPVDPRTWQMMAIWDELLGDGSDIDRTRMYLDRAARQHAQDVAAEEHDRGSLFATLGLEVTIRPAGRSDIKRAAELVNRTNQFNMTAARTTFAEMKGWSESDSHAIYLASMRDRFGDMGVIAVLVASYDDRGASIPVFVLSCRVFGYDVETVLLNTVKQDALARGCGLVAGWHVETMVNAPCRDTYAQNGFVETGGQWVWTEACPRIDDPKWLDVRSAA
ncbi:HAD-IIIC family phosphatase [Palleronia aestuarii]|nr:HAD-IIIC family phosphatase [Palleronia aestuarii]